MSAEENERLWRLLREFRETLQSHLSESTEHRQQTAVQLALIRADMQEHRAIQAEAISRLAVRSGAVSAIGAGSVVTLWPIVQMAWPAVRAGLHAVGLW